MSRVSLCVEHNAPKYLSKPKKIQIFNSVSLIVGSFKSIYMNWRKKQIDQPSKHTKTRKYKPQKQKK